MAELKFDAIIFDFDGVLVESVDVKTRAFATLYESYGPIVVKEVVAYHLQHGGMSRFEKFRYFHENLLGKSFSKKVEQDLCEKFSELVEEAVVRAPFVKGAIEFLLHFQGQIDLFVASGTPDDELKRIANRRSIDKYFIELYGSPAIKSTIIDDIVLTKNYKRSRVLMIGDAMTDYLAAKQTNINFVWRISEPQIPAPTEVQLIKNLTELEDLIQA